MDVYVGGAQRDKVSGSEFNYLIFTGKGGDEITASAGCDFILGGEGNDTVDYSFLGHMDPIFLTVDKVKDLGATGARDKTAFVEIVKNTGTTEQRDILLSIGIIKGTDYLVVN